jgi:hypothetical protein
MLGIAWAQAGFVGFYLVTLLSLLGYFGAVVALARRLGAHPLPTIPGVLGVVLLALPMLSPRATLVAQTLFLVAVLGLDSARRHAARWPLTACAPLALLGGFVLAGTGMWLHLSWLALAPAIWLSSVVLLAATPGVSAPRRLVMTGAFGAGLAGGLLAGPYGRGALPFSQQVRAASQGLVLEWLSPLTPGLWLRWVPALLVALVASSVAVAWVVRRWADRAADQRVPLVAAVLVLCLPAAVGGIFAVRFIGVALLALAPLAAMAATSLAQVVRARAADQEPPGPFRLDRVRFWSRAAPWRTVLSAVLVLLSPLVLYSASRLGRPMAESAAIGTLPSGCRLFSDPGSAGVAILLRRDISVWFDTRADYYGRERNAQAIDVLATADADDPVLARASCILLARSSPVTVGPLPGSLDSNPLWRRTWSGGGVTAWTRIG